MEHTEVSLKDALIQAELQNDEKIIHFCLKSLADLAEDRRDYEQALYYFKKLHHFEMTLANEEIKGKSKDILDSIRYAYRIQTAIAPPMYIVERLLPKQFILYLPKDVVSGDFYYVSEFHDKVLFAAVDCTGHGVPGALMSVIGFNALVQAVRDPEIDTPAKVLSFLDKSVNDILRQTHDESGVKDSMDLAVCSVDYKTNEFMYAGAFNPLYYVHKGELFEIKADKLPIGVNIDGVVDVFTDHKIPLVPGDAVYIFSDGYADQFGGPLNKKFKYNQLKDVILSVQDKTMPEQRDILEKTIRDWQGEEEQVDDILVMGVQV
jgi:serine phosphatase RsbU (regulator of sigma subunit)